MLDGKICSVMSIAGTDSSGGAGIQADLKTFTALNCYGTSAITAITAQNTIGVQDVHPCPPEFVRKQIYSILDDIQISGIKTGMLFDAETVRVVADSLKTRFGQLAPNLVCDPVMVSTSGHNLLESAAVDVMTSNLFPLATLITPNLAEAELLLQRPLQSLDSMLEAAQDLLQFGSKAVLLKGGHLIATMDDVMALSNEIQVVKAFLIDENMEILKEHGAAIPPAVVVDVLQQKEGPTTVFVRPRIESTSTHGTGCTLSAAICCGLGQGLDVVEATRSATTFTFLGIETAPAIGKGHGPLNHMHSISRSCVPQRTALNPYPLTSLLIQSSIGTWKSYVEHEFVRLLGQGTLSRDSFIHFIKQDYHYLKYYARAYALLAAKSSSFRGIQSATATIINVLNEIGTHRSFCEQFGVSSAELEATEESPATTAYGAYLIDVGLQGDQAKLLMALLACLLGYGEVGLWLKKESSGTDSWVKTKGNAYAQWMEDYSGAHYQAAVKLGMETIESLASDDPPSLARYTEWSEVWRRCTKFERDFWDMAMKKS
ncbi:Phosphomethylpyrimidine kinase-domain-containing protein [Mycena floridula]|nr:Phosphomethylpyrimidine kinase-domain-containing protein [Mycena floridula]